ncbi:DUF2730 family protein [Roseospira visakhapatnamensis]|uniref:DUF2730 family protein n=1 Tax=Roseospira visakhapatnamensis TaxID=390880 RepID=A0A7W6RGU2_9PROT|nr:DUF2730 family protein [Roseospira visakhapatnamensis]MBB4267779.1 hypothetical protein [Roseospira visakhapatnamensis]
MDGARLLDWLAGLGAWAGLITMAGLGVVLWRLWPVFAPRSDVSALATDVRRWRDAHGGAHVEITQRLDRGEARFARLEARIEGLPTHADMTALTTLVAEVGGQVRELNGRLDGLTRVSTRLERSVDMLMENELAQGRRDGGEPS